MPLSKAPVIDLEVRDPQTKRVIQILRNPVDGPYGFDPGDPVVFTGWLRFDRGSPACRRGDLSHIRRIGRRDSSADRRQ